MGRTGAGGEFPFEAATAVPRPLLHHRWSDLAFLHWPYDPEPVQALLPGGVTVDTIDGAAWVGLVPFQCTIHPAGLPRIPWLSSFPEMNVRTYVRGPDGSPAVWFITLDAARLVAAGLARLAYGLAYRWAKMTFTRCEDVATYSARRRLGASSGTSGSVVLRIGSIIDPVDATPLERWLTNRWRFFCPSPVGLIWGLVEHEPWELRRAELLQCDPGLVTAAGLPSPQGIPLVHFGGTVEVSMSRPYLAVKHRRGSRSARLPSGPEAPGGGFGAWAPSLPLNHDETNRGTPRRARSGPRRTEPGAQVAVAVAGRQRSCPFA